MHPHRNNPALRGAHPAGGTHLPNEICVSGHPAPMAASQHHVLIHNRGIAHSAKHGGLAPISELDKRYNEKAGITETESVTTLVPAVAMAAAANGRHLEPENGKNGMTNRADWRVTNSCPGAPQLRVRTSACNPENPRQYFITCEYSASQGLGVLGTLHMLSKCNDDEVCVSAYTAATPTSPDQDPLKRYGIAHCVKHDRFDRIAQPAGKYEQRMESIDTGSMNTKSQKTKWKLGKRNSWNHIDQCPKELTNWTFITPVCDSDDPRKYWISCHAPYANGRYGPTIISRQAQCSETEFCVSGYEGTLPQTPIPDYQVQNFGIAKCASQQSFVRIATLVTTQSEEKGGEGHAKRATNRPENDHKVLQAVVETERIKVTRLAEHGAGQAASSQRSQKYPTTRPVDMCFGKYRGWTVINSSCRPLGGSHKHFRIWCSQYPYSFRGLHAKIYGKCADEEICVPGAGGTKVIPDPMGRKRYLMNARRAACVSVEKFVRIAKLAVDRKARARKARHPQRRTQHTMKQTAVSGDRRRRERPR